MDAQQLAALRLRLPEHHLRQRLLRQTQHTVMRFEAHDARLFEWYWENFTLMPRLLEAGLRLTGRLENARQAAIRYRVNRHDVPLPRLPAAFDGYTILHLSDLHIDSMPDGGAALISALDPLRFDLCVLTGDYRFETWGCCDDTYQRLALLMPALACADGVVAILGNHDFIEMVPCLESLGMTVLLNESTRIERHGAQLWLAGLDDCHFYQVDDLAAATRAIPPGACSLLLVHSPERIAEAAAADVDLYLCGHTHGGQVCLPGGIPIITNARCARRFVRGWWRCEGMPGYTSSGTGASGLPVRIHCPPDISLHTLGAPAAGR